LGHLSEITFKAFTGLDSPDLQNEYFINHQYLPKELLDAFKIGPSCDIVKNT
jgi:hypothetical protein